MLRCLILLAACMTHHLEANGRLIANDAHDDAAERLVRDRIERQLEALEQSIFAHEASQPRDTLMRRRFTVDTFLLAATVPQAIAFAAPPDLAPLWRQDFRGEPRALAGPRGWLGRRTLLGAHPADAIAGRFVIELLEPVAGDDAVAIGGRFLVTPETATLVATWCEPCLHPESVDFPIVPEAFLLAWDQSVREVATLLPAPRAHRESVRDEPPRLDQPEDLYDLFDGVRALPRAARDSFDRTLDRSGRDDREPLDATVHVAHDEDGIALQRVTSEPGAAHGEVVVTIEQPPVRCRWSSPRRYELHGDVAGDPTAIRSIVPQGEVASLPAAITAAFRIRAGSATGTIHRGTRLLATMRWDAIDPLTPDEALRERDRLREPFHQVLASSNAEHSPDRGHGHRAMPLPAPLEGLDAIDPVGADLRGARHELRAASLEPEADTIDRAFGSHRRAIAEQSLDASTLWRGIEAQAEALASVEASARLASWLDGPGAAALATLPSESLVAMLADRLRMGRFGAGMLLASELASRAEVDRATHTWASDVLDRLIDACRDDRPRAVGSDRPPPPLWWEPPGRSRLAALVAARFAETRSRAVASPPRHSLAGAAIHRASNNSGTIAEAAPIELSPPTISGDDSP